MRLSTHLLLILALASCQREALAQGADPALGPILCFEKVDAIGIAGQTAAEVCSRATSAAPGDCFVEATKRVGDLTSTDLVQLCQGATSLDPLDCYERLDAAGSLTSEQLIGYCAPECPLGPAPPQSSSAACVEQALDRTQLAEQSVGELCQRSRSAMPVECFLRGENTTQLSDSQLVQLCTQTFSCQYVNAAPAY